MDRQPVAAGRADPGTAASRQAAEARRGTFLICRTSVTAPAGRCKRPPAHSSIYLILPAKCFLVEAGTAAGAEAGAVGRASAAALAAVAAALAVVAAVVAAAVAAEAALASLSSATS